MRRQTFALVALLSLSAFACGEDPLPPPATPPPPVAPPPPPPTQEPPPAPPPKQLSFAEAQRAGLAAALEGLNTHDPKKFASVYADNAVINVAGLNQVNGREAIAANMAEWFETFSNAKLGFSRVWLKGDAMVIEWVINGVHHGQLFGVKGTEQPIGHYGLSIISFQPDGKVSREERYGDLGTVMTQVTPAGAKAKPRAIPPVPKDPETITSAAGEDKNLEVAKAALTALETKKEADFAAALTDDVEHDGLFHLETTKGKDQAKKFFKSFTTAFPDAKFEISKSLAIGDYAIVESTLKGTHKGALGSIQPTKKPIAIHLVDIFKVKDGKIARVWTYQNSLEMQQQLGLFNVPTAGNVPASQVAPKPAAAPAATPAAPAAPAPKTGGGGGGGGGGTGGGGGKDTGGGGGKGTGGGTGGGGKK